MSNVKNNCIKKKLYYKHIFTHFTINNGPSIFKVNRYTLNQGNIFLASTLQWQKCQLQFQAPKTCAMRQKKKG